MGHQTTSGWRSSGIFRLGIKVSCKDGRAPEMRAREVVPSHSQHPAPPGRLVCACVDNVNLPVNERKELRVPFSSKHRVNRLCPGLGVREGVGRAEAGGEAWAPARAGNSRVAAASSPQPTWTWSLLYRPPVPPARHPPPCPPG